MNLSYPKHLYTPTGFIGYYTHNLEIKIDISYSAVRTNSSAVALLLELPITSTYTTQ